MCDMSKENTIKEDKDYRQLIKNYQLDGTLDAIREEIRLHDEEESKKRREDENYKRVIIHFPNKLMELLGLDPESELGDLIGWYLYDLAVHDEEYKKSVEVYDAKIRAIQKEEDDAYFESLREAVKKADPKVIENALGLLNKFLKDI